MSNDTFSLENFSGTTRLFPLPNLVVFPHVVQPLHIFESRYVEMLEHAVADDSLFAMGLLLPGWEGEYDGRPPVDPFVCLGRIISHSPTKDGRYNILLAGIARAKIIRELPAQRSYRQVEVEVLDDIEAELAEPELTSLHDALVKAFRRFVPQESSAQQHFDDILNKQSHLGTLTDLISYSLPLELAFRQVLLAEVDVVERTRLLLDHLNSEELASTDERPFPPDFSLN